ELQRRIRPIAEAYKVRSAELGRDAMIVFPRVFHWALIAFLAVGEFPLNTVVFRLFGEAEYLTYVMASTLAITIPLIGVFIGVHVRHVVPKWLGNLLIGILTPVVVAATLYAVSLLRNTYITSQLCADGKVSAAGDRRGGDVATRPGAQEVRLVEQQEGNRRAVDGRGWCSTWGSWRYRRWPRPQAARDRLTPPRSGAPGWPNSLSPPPARREMSRWR